MTTWSLEGTKPQLLTTLRLTEALCDSVQARVKGRLAVVMDDNNDNKRGIEDCGRGRGGRRGEKAEGYKRREVQRAVRGERGERRLESRRWRHVYVYTGTHVAKQLPLTDTCVCRQLWL